MKKGRLRWLFIFLLMNFQLKEPLQKPSPLSKKKISSIKRLEYRVHYGWLNAGTAQILFDPKVHTIAGTPCYKIDVYGQSKKWLNILVKVQDHWGSYIDTTHFITHCFYQNILEGSYQKNEIVTFDHKRKIAIVNQLDKDTKALIDTTVFHIPYPIQDIISAPCYLRLLDFNTMAIGDTITLPTFFDNHIFNIKILFLGREPLKTKIGRYTALVLSPIVPKNSFFARNNPVKMWLSDDERKILLKISAHLVVGAIEIDIKHLEEEH